MQMSLTAVTCEQIKLEHAKLPRTERIRLFMLKPKLADDFTTSRMRNLSAFRKFSRAIWKILGYSPEKMVKLNTNTINIHAQTSITWNTTIRHKHIHLHDKHGAESRIHRNLSLSKSLIERHKQHTFFAFSVALGS